MGWFPTLAKFAMLSVDQLVNCRPLVPGLRIYLFIYLYPDMTINFLKPNNKILILIFKNFSKKHTVFFVQF